MYLGAEKATLNLKRLLCSNCGADFFVWTRLLVYKIYYVCQGLRPSIRPPVMAYILESNSDRRKVWVCYSLIFEGTTQDDVLIFCF